MGYILNFESTKSFLILLTIMHFSLGTVGNDCAKKSVNTFLLFPPKKPHAAVVNHNHCYGYFYPSLNQDQSSIDLKVENTSSWGNI